MTVLFFIYFVLLLPPVWTRPQSMRIEITETYQTMNIIKQVAPPAQMQQYYIITYSPVSIIIDTDNLV